MTSIYTTRELCDPVSKDPIGQFHAVVTNASGEVKQVICHPVKCIHYSAAEADACERMKAERKRVFPPRESERLPRCAMTCPHGDRCRRDAGHEGGCNHLCECNEPSAEG